MKFSISKSFKRTKYYVFAIKSLNTQTKLLIMFLSTEAGTGRSTHPISGVLRLRNPFSFLLILFGWLFAASFCACSCFCCSNSSCSCCWVSSNCWNFKLPLLVSFSSVGSTNSSCERLWRHQKYAAANRISSSTMIPSVERTPINIMRPKSAVERERRNEFMIKWFDLTWHKNNFAFMLIGQNYQGIQQKTGVRDSAWRNLHGILVDFLCIGEQIIRYSFKQMKCFALWS